MSENQDNSEQMKVLYYNKLNKIEHKINSFSIPTKEKYNELILEVEKAKLSEKKSFTDSRRLHRYEILTVAGEKKLILNTNDKQNLKYFVCEDEIFDIIHNTHISLGHGGRNKLEKKYKIVMLILRGKI